MTAIEPTLGTRDTILAAATDLFARQGLEATSIKAIGAAAGVNPALLYYYFADKHALYQAVIDQMIAELPGHLTDTALHAASPASGLAEVVRRQAEVFLRQPLLPRLIARELADHEAGHATPRLRDQARRLLAAITGLIRAGQAAGEFRRDLTPELAAISVLSQINWFCIAGPVVEVILDQPGVARDPKALRRFAEHVVQFSVAGLEPPHDRGAS